MAVTVAQLKAVLGIDDRDFRAGLDGADRRLKNFAGSAEQSGEKAARGISAAFSRVDLGSLSTKLSIGVTAPLLAAGAAAIKVASNTNEAMNKVNVVFGQSAAEMKAWAATSSEAFGQSRRMALGAAGDFGNLFVSMDIGGKQAAEMSRRMVELASDLKSFNDVPVEEALVAIRAGLVGETEPLRRFGVNLNEAALKTQALRMGLVQTTKEALEPGIKAQAAYALILEQTKTAQGDYKNTQDSVSNASQRLKAEVEDLAERFGTDLLPMTRDALKVGVDLLKFLNDVPQPARQAAFALAGIGIALGPTIRALKDTVELVKFLTGANALGTLAKVAAPAAAAKTIVDGGAAATAVGTAAGAGGAAGLARRFAGSGKNAADELVQAVGGTGRRGVSGGVIGQLGGKGLLTLLLGGASAGTVAAAAAAGGTAQFLGGNAARWLDQKGGPLGTILANTLENVGGLPVAAIRRQELLKGLLGMKAKAASPAGAPGAGGTGAGTPTAPGKAPLPEDPDQLLAAADAQFEALKARLGAQLAAGAEESKAQREAAVMIPALTARQKELAKRAAELQPKVAESAKSREEYLQIEAESWGLSEQITDLQVSAQKELRENAKKAAEKAKQARDDARELQQLQARAREFQAEAILAAVPADRKAQAEAQVKGSLLGRRDQELALEAQSLLGLTDRDSTRRRAEIEAERAQLLAENGRLQAAAAKERGENAKKAKDAAQKTMAAETAAQEQALDARLATVAQEKRAQATAALKIPFLTRMQTELRAQLDQLKPGTEAYFETEKRIWEAEEQKGQLASAAAAEVKSAQQKATDAARKQAGELNDVAELKVRLLKAQLDNNPLLSGAAKGRLLAGAQIQQYRQLMTPVEGESEKGRLQRMLEAEGVRGNILGTLGAGPGGLKRTLGGGLLPMFNPRAVAGVNRELDAIAGGSFRAMPRVPRQPQMNQIVINLPAADARRTGQVVERRLRDLDEQYSGGFGGE